MKHPHVHSVCRSVSHTVECHTGSLNKATTVADAGQLKHAGCCRPTVNIFHTYKHLDSDVRHDLDQDALDGQIDQTIQTVTSDPW